MKTSMRGVVGALLFGMIIAAAGACSGSGSSPSPSAGGGNSSTATPTGGRLGPASPAPSGVGGPTGVPVATGGDVCALLGPGDFSAAGIAGAHTPTESPDGSGGNYCVYSGRSSATGGIEFDAFVIDGPSTYQTIVGEVGPVTSISAADLPGADEAGVNLADEGGSASIVVRKGNLSFDIGFQAGSNARTQLIALAALVLQRGSGLG